MKNLSAIATAVAAMLVLAQSAPSQPQSPADDAEEPIEMPASSDQALERMKEEVAEQKKKRPPEPRGPVSFGVPVRSASSRESGDALRRNGVEFVEDWTIRAGVTRLRIPARNGWIAVSPNSAFFSQQVEAGTPGEHLALLLVNKAYVTASKSKYVNFYSEIRVPQEYAFKLMTPASFAPFKAGIQEAAVETRMRLIQRDDFEDFDDYLNFKFGRDEAVDSFVDGFMVRAIDEPDLVIYFATSEFVYDGPREDTVEPMMVTVCYALVNEKLIRYDTRRVFSGQDDIAVMLAETKAFISDMRRLNDLQERKSILP